MEKEQFEYTDVREQFENETGEKWWTNPVCHGETGFASWKYQEWLEKKLSTAFINGKLHPSSFSQFKPLVITQAARGVLRGFSKISLIITNTFKNDIAGKERINKILADNKVLTEKGKRLAIYHIYLDKVMGEESRLSL